MNSGETRVLPVVKKKEEKPESGYGVVKTYSDMGEEVAGFFKRYRNGTPGRKSKK